MPRLPIRSLPFLLLLAACAAVPTSSDSVLKGGPSDDECAVIALDGTDGEFYACHEQGCGYCFAQGDEAPGRCLANAESMSCAGGDSFQFLEGPELLGCVEETAAVLDAHATAIGPANRVFATTYDIDSDGNPEGKCNERETLGCALISRVLEVDPGASSVTLEVTGLRRGSYVSLRVDAEGPVHQVLRGENNVILAWLRDGAMQSSCEASEGELLTPETLARVAALVHIEPPATY